MCVIIFLSFSRLTQKVLVLLSSLCDLKGRLD